MMNVQDLLRLAGDPSKITNEERLLIGQMSQAEFVRSGEDIPDVRGHGMAEYKPLLRAKVMGALAQWIDLADTTECWPPTRTV